MKTNCWMVLGAMIASSAIAQNNTNTLPEIPAPATSVAAEATATPAAVAPAPSVEPKAAPAKPPKRAVVRRAIKEPAVSLVPGPAQVAVSNLAVRGQAGLKGEVITHLPKGDSVTVLDQINLGKHAVGEPAHWAKIALPSSVHVWVNAKYIDGANKTVSTKRLNLRAGPGENFSVLGTLEHGTPVNELETKGNWIKIEAPASAYAFVAAMYLNQTAPPPVVAAAPPPTPMPVAEAQPIVTTPPAMPPPVEPPAPAPNPTPAMAAIDTNVPPPPRIVSHEGVVRHVGSIIAPTEYELYDPTTDKNINYLYPTISTLDLSKYAGSRVVVTGEEGLAARWKDIPVLTVESIRVIQANAVPRVIYNSPRQSQAH
jgi:uncharacterized protein YgiM (DUF1202 family)